LVAFHVGHSGVDGGAELALPRDDASNLAIQVSDVDCIASVLLLDVGRNLEAVRVLGELGRRYESGEVNLVAPGGEGV